MKNKKTPRYPLYQIADRLKYALAGAGFTFIDNGEGDEVEKFAVTFPTWEEPKELFGRANEPVKLREGHTVLRTRLLPAYLSQECLARHGLLTPVRMAAYGRVYYGDEKQPVHHQIEGAAFGKVSAGDWEKVWSRIATSFMGEKADAHLEQMGEASYKIMVTPRDGKPFLLGYGGNVSEEAAQRCGFNEADGQVFVIDIDEVTMALFGFKTTKELYGNNVKKLAAYDYDYEAFGEGPAVDAVDILRSMGYQETCGDVLYADNVYKKMNMIQASWDRNNKGYPLVEKLGEFSSLRTVLTPALEDILAQNYKAGNETVRAFEVGHIYLPRAGKILPKEHISVSMSAYGGGITIESFRKDVESFLHQMGIREVRFRGTGMAIAYKWNECYLIYDGEDDYLNSNCGQISRKAQKNYGIGTAAYMANFELTSVTESALDRKRTNKQKAKDEIDRD